MPRDHLVIRPICWKLQATIQYTRHIYTAHVLTCSYVLTVFGMASEKHMDTYNM